MIVACAAWFGRVTVKSSHPNLHCVNAPGLAVLHGGVHARLAAAPIFARLALRAQAGGVFLKSGATTSRAQSVQDAQE